MAEPHLVLNRLSDADARAALSRCCGARRWVEGMLLCRPFASHAALLASADEVWAQLGRADCLEAFSHHPKIGEDLDQLRARFQTTSAWSSAEQSGVIDADERTLTALCENNRAYERRFGYIFIVCATGRSARELLALLTARLENSAEDELIVAAAEQAQITKLRLEHRIG